MTSRQAGYQYPSHQQANRNQKHQEIQRTRVVVLAVIEVLAQTCQSVVGLLACDDERGERSGQVLHDTGKAFNLCVLRKRSVVIVRERGAWEKKSMGNTNNPSDVGGIVDTAKLNRMLAAAISRGMVQLTASCV